jgi:glycerophosphoryl diester phosphodiesterase
MHRPLILGHRGYRARFPENTLRAFQEAHAAGAAGIECDLQKCAEGRFVIIHDPTTDRVTGVRRNVAAASLVELKSLDFGNGERLPTLEELLAALPSDSWLDLELKEETLEPSDAARIAAILDSHRPRKRLMISSFSPDLLVPFKRKGFTVGFLVGEEAAARGIWGFARVLFRLRPQFLNLPVDMLALLGQQRAGMLFRLLRALGFALLFWTVNSPADLEIVARHARIIVTDEVELIVKALSPFTEN